MKLLVVCDIHDEEAAVARIRARMAEGFDHLIVCGDLSRSVSFAEDFLSQFPDAFVIPGNWDSEGVNGVMRKAKNYAHGRRLELAEGLNLVGFGYSNITPFHTYGELTEEKIYQGMSPLQIDRNTLLALHCPPKGHFDEARGAHVGSESILKIIREKKPLAAFFGHIHELSGSSKLGATELVKVPGANGLLGAVARTSGRKLELEFVML
jgi:Icc-related predicted phosphoesterase